MSCPQNAGQDRNINLAINPFENVAEFKNVDRLKHQNFEDDSFLVRSAV
jgi:hypothetical protein